MCFFVCCQRTLDGKRLVTVVAFVRLVMCVNANVPHNVARLLKFLLTVDTSVPLHAVHLPHSTSTHQIIVNHHHHHQQQQQQDCPKLFGNRPRRQLWSTHAPPQTAATTIHTLLHSYAVNFPLVTMGSVKFTPNLSSPVYQSPNYLPHPWTNPTYHPKPRPYTISRFATIVFGIGSVSVIGVNHTICVMYFTSPNCSQFYLVITLCWSSEVPYETSG